MYFPGYYSIQNLSSAVSHGSCSLRHENRNLKNGQQYEVFLTRPVTDGFHGWHKEKLRQTILMHESIFTHQLNELHRLYERQEDLMNEMRSKELLKHKKAIGVSQSTFSSSGFPTGGYTKSWHLSNLPMVDSSYGRRSTLSTCISQSPCDAIGKTLQNSGVPSQSRVGMKDHESLDSRGKKPRRKLFNLELPAEECLSDEEEPDGGLGLGTDKYGCNNNASSSDLHLVRSNGLGTDGGLGLGTDKSGCNNKVCLTFKKNNCGKAHPNACKNPSACCLHRIFTIAYSGYRNNRQIHSILPALLPQQVKPNTAYSHTQSTCCYCHHYPKTVLTHTKKAYNLPKSSEETLTDKNKKNTS